MTPIRVMIVDDHAMVRDGLQALLAQQAELEVVGLAADGIEALQMARECQPDVVLMDLGMRRMGGIEATRRLLALCPPVAVIVLTMSDDDTSLLAAMRSGARGYLLKEADGHDVIAAIHTVMGGQVLFGQGVAASVLQLLDDPPARRDPPFKNLSNRELQILELVASGATNPGIARQLNISNENRGEHAVSDPGEDRGSRPGGGCRKGPRRRSRGTELTRLKRHKV